MSTSHTRSEYANPPHKPTIPIKSYTPHIPQPLIDNLKQRLHNSVDILTTYENSYAGDDQMGITKEWMEETLGVWKGDWDW